MSKGTAVVPFDQAPVPAHIQQAFGDQKNDDLYHEGGLPTLSFRGKVWRYSIKGEEVDVVNGEGEPQASIEVVLLKANPRASKAYYEKKYTEGDSSMPTCWSLDGIKPDSGVTEPVHDSCQACPKNVMGSRITEEGKKAKACQDRRRIAVVPADLSTVPLMLTCPPTSVWDRDNAVNEAKGWYALAQYGDYLNKRGAKYQGIVTRIGFDSRKAYPKLLFKAVRWLSADELARVQELAGSEDVNLILGTGEGAPEQTKPTVVRDDPPAEAEKPKATVTSIKAKAKPVVDEDAPPAANDDDPPAAVEAPKPAAKAAAAKPARKAAPAVASDDLDEELNNILGNLDD